MGDGGVYIKRYPEDTEGFYLPALGATSSGQVTQTSTYQIAYWTYAGYEDYSNDYDNSDPPQIINTNYYQKAKMFRIGHTSWNDLASYSATLPHVRPYETTDAGYAVPIIPQRRYTGPAGDPLNY